MYIINVEYGVIKTDNIWQNMASWLYQQSNNYFILIIKIWENGLKIDKIFYITGADCLWVITVNYINFKAIGKLKIRQ